MRLFRAWGVLALAWMLGVSPAYGKKLNPKNHVDLERIIDSMTVEEKVGQLLLIGFMVVKIGLHLLGPQWLHCL